MTPILEGMRAKRRADHERAIVFWIRFCAGTILLIAFALALAGELPELEQYFF